MIGETRATLLLLILFIALVSFPNVRIVIAEPKTIVVPDDYPTIGWAIGNASEGDTIFVKKGTYYENIQIDKSLSLIGEDKTTTIIDGGKSGDVVKIVHDRVNITGFTFQNAFDPTYTPDPFVPSLVGGVKIFGAHYCNITGNIVKNNTQGILLHVSTHNLISRNIVTSNTDNGVLLYASANNNTISENNATNNRRGITLQESVGFNTFYGNNIDENSIAGILHYRTSFDNSFVRNNITRNHIGVQIGSSARTIFHHNNFVNNAIQVSYVSPYVIPPLIWDNGTEGNYWSDYNGTDGDGDGIGDTPYIINENNQDNHPLMNIISEFKTIYIRADGTVEGTDKIQREGNVYTFTDNINGEIVVEMDGIVIDGDSYTLQGIGNGTGIYLRKRTNVTIQNIAIKNFTYGIYLKGTSTQRSINNKILGNNITDNMVGIILDYSPYNVLRNNRMANNTYNFKVLWDFPPTEASDFINDVDTSNTVDGKPIYYLINQSNLVISPSTFPDLGFLALIECTNMTVQNLDLVNEGQGLILAYTTNSLVTKNKIADNSYWGIILADSHNNSIIENYIIDNVIGIALEVDSGYNIISGNNITNNSGGVSFYGVSNNTISANSITNNNDGISSMDSDNNSVIGNTIMNNEKGIYFFQCYNNSIYNNSFINNTKQVYDNIWEQPWYPQLLSVNIWDNGTTGNYWSNYNGTDNDSDSIGDTPYIINENNRDNYPLMEPTIIREFPSWTPLLITLVAVVAIIFVFRYKLKKQRRFNEV